MFPDHRGCENWQGDLVNEVDLAYSSHGMRLGQTDLFR